MPHRDEAAEFIALLSDLHARKLIDVSLLDTKGSDHRSPMEITLRIEPTNSNSGTVERGRYH
jgi:hypothetical protein